MSVETDLELWHEPRMLVAGELVPAADGRTFDNVDPATEQAVAEGVR